MNRCKPEQLDTKEHGKMLNIVLKLVEGRVPDRKEKEWKSWREKKGHQDRMQEVERGI